MDYRNEYRRIESDVFWTFPRALFAICLMVVIVGTVTYVAGWFSEGASVAQEQFGARALLTKYEWFKDASAQLDQKLATAKVYESRFSDLKSSYNGEPRSKWSREDREQYSIWQSELTGIKASYNDLAAQYNAEMVKFNWRFANVGELPQGASIPLPRQYKPYTTE